MLKKSDCNAKITEIEGKIPSICGLSTNAVLTGVEDKIPNISSLVKKTNYNTKIAEIENKFTDHSHDKYITTPDFNTLAADVFNKRLAQANLITKNEFEKLKTFDSIYVRAKRQFEEDGTQNYLVFQPIQKYFTRTTSVGNGNHIYYWKSKGLSDERINSIKTSDYGITPYLSITILIQ